MTPTAPPGRLDPSPAPLMTAVEFVDRHGGEGGIELVKGCVARLPMPGAEHGQVCVRLAYFLLGYALERDAGRVMSNDTFIRTSTDPDTYRGADVCFLSYARLPKAAPLPGGPLEIPPELVAEVRSPHDRAGDIQVKVGEYLNAGVGAVVVLDPGTGAAAVYRPGGEAPRRFGGGDDLTVPDVLPGFTVPVRRLFE